MSARVSSWPLVTARLSRQTPPHDPSGVERVVFGHEGGVVYQLVRARRRLRALSANADLRRELKRAELERQTAQAWSPRRSRPTSLLSLLQGQGRPGRLQGPRCPASLHQRARQDQVAARDRYVPPPLAPGRRRGQARPRDGAPAVRHDRARAARGRRSRPQAVIVRRHPAARRRAGPAGARRPRRAAVSQVAPPVPPWPSRG